MSNNTGLKKSRFSPIISGILYPPFFKRFGHIREKKPFSSEKNGSRKTNNPDFNLWTKKIKQSKPAKFSFVMTFGLIYRIYCRLLQLFMQLLNGCPVT